MSALLLQINLDLQTGAAITALNAIESSVDKIVNKLQQFSQFFSNNPVNIIQPQQNTIANNLLDAIKDINKAGLSIDAQNMSDIANRKRILDEAIALVNVSKLQGEELTMYNVALKKQLEQNTEFTKYYKDVNKFQKDHKDLLDNILKGRVTELKLTKSQKIEFDKYISALKTAEQRGGVHLTMLGKNVDEVKKMRAAINDINVESTKHIDIWNKISSVFTGFLVLLPTAGILISALKGPLSGIKDSLSEMHNMWKKNNQVSNNFLVNANGKTQTLSQSMIDMRNNIASAGGGLSKEFEKLDSGLGNVTITADQADEAIGSVLASSFKSVAKGSKDAAGELSLYASIIAHTSRSTGMASNQTTELMLRVGSLGIATSSAIDIEEKHRDGLKASIQLNSVLTNITEKYGMSVNEVSHVAQILNKNMNLLRSSYKGNAELLKAGIPLTTQYTVMLSSLGKAAKDAGYDSNAAMDSFADSMAKPMDNILLLGKTLMSTDPSAQMAEIGKNAEKYATQISKMPPALQNMMSMQLTGKPVAELNSMAAASKGLREEMDKKYGNLSEDAKRVAITKEMTSRKEAEAKATIAQNDANNNLTKALDRLRVIFGQIASGLQPVINILAALLDNDIAPWVILAAGSLTALGVSVFAVGKSLSMFKDSLSSITGTFKSMVNYFKSGSKVVDKTGESLKAAGENSKSLSGVKSGGLRGFALELKGFFDTMARIKMGGVLKTVGVIALVGVSLSVGVAALGLAANLLPPDKAAQLAITVGGIVAASWILSKMTSIGPKALIGAALVGLVGASLAVGVGLLGMASEGITLEQTGVLGIMVGGLLVTMGILALMAPLIVPALIGAAGLAAVGALLAIGVAALGSAISLIDPSQIAKLFEALSSVPLSAGPALIGMAAGLAAFAAALAGGAIMSFFTGGIVANAEKMAVAMNTLLGPITALGGVGDQVGKSFVSIADGLKVFVEAINDSSGWFSSFEGKAERVASAISKIAKPMQDMQAINSVDPQQPNHSEEIKKSFALTIEASNNSNKEIIKELKEIKALLADNSDDSVGPKLDQSVEVLKKILNEMVMGGGFGTTSANGDYAA